MLELRDIIARHPVFADIAPERARLLAGCARNHHFPPGSWLLREGGAADEFYLIRHGRVALDIHAPGRAPLTIATLGDGDLLGASWLVPPYRWQFDARALEDTRAIGIDAACLRAKADADPGFGYDMMKRFVPLLVRRLQATRLQLLDVYAAP
jgi:CRP-like cAMP-binding protein